ncbi:MAG: FecCD family ABC transporter permease [Saccharofermentanales bacterium]
MNKRQVTIPKILLAGLPVLFISVVFATAFGTVSYNPIDIIRVILNKTNLLPAESISKGIEISISMIRLPRVMSAVIAGAGLAISGVVMQGVFRNPLAEPGLLGVSAGGGLGTLIAMALGVASFYILPIFAFAGAMSAVSIILVLSLVSRSKTNTVTMIMSGMAVSAMFGAMISIVLTLSDQYQVSGYIFWTMGGLVNRRWEHFFAMLIPVAVSMLLMIIKAKDLDILLLGDEEAKALGVRPTFTRISMILLASVCTASIVSVTGPIGFVGLIVPHIMRMLIGPSHRRLVVASAIAGSVFLLLCDFITRMLSIPIRIEFSCGVITALIGAPYFIFLLVRANRNSGVF